jgi:hypothetical protein
MELSEASPALKIPKIEKLEDPNISWSNGAAPSTPNFWRKPLN